DIYLLADLDASNINPLAPDLPANTDFAEGGDGNVLAQSNIAANSSDVIVYGQNIEVDGTVYSDGMIVMAAADNITLDDWVESVGDMYLYADYDADAGSAMGEFVEDNVGKMWAKSSLTTTGSDITVYGQDIQVDGDVDSSGMIVMGAADDITLGDNVSEDSVEAVGDIWLLADLDASSIDPVDPQLTDNDYLDENGDGDVHAKSTITTTGSDVIVYGENIEVDGYVDSSGMIVMGAADNITLDDWVQSVGDMYLYSDFDADAGVMGAFVEDNVGHMWAKSTLTSTGGQIDISAADNTIKLDDDVTADEDILLRNSTVVAGGKTLKSTNDDVVLAGGKYLSYSGAGGTLTVEAGDDIIFGVDDVDNHWDNPQNPLNGTPGNVTSNGDLILTAGDDIYAHGWLQTFNGGDIIATATDDVYVYGDIYADGDIEIYSDNTTTNLFGDLIQAVGNILLDNNTIFGSGVDQLVDAQTGGITANGSLQKPNESLYLEAAGNVSLDGPVTANNGGVSIISETGTIFTPDGLGDPTDTLNVPISGYSDDAAGDGVVLPYGPGRAAIVIMSAETLNVGPLAVLSADGIYDTTGAVDDRAGVDFLDAPGAYIPLPGGPLRDEGDPFDAAIYVASTTGNVDVSSPVTITSTEWINEEPFPVPGGAMVIDAWDTVTFDGGVPGGLFEQSLAGSNVGSYVGDRLEVCSRITEWLFQAYNNGRLPYVYGGGPFPDGYDYVLRGAGLGNPSISTTGSTVAWVLEDPIEPAPFGEDLIPGTEEVAFGEGGCPVLMAWLAEELGIPEETIQVYLADAFLYSTAIQPCEACARLLEAATVLEDLEGTRIAALAQVVNEFVAPDAPIAPEQMASIASAMVSPEAGTYYAAGGEWLDALAAYVSILSAEMGFSVPESVAFVNKYLTPVAELDNASLAAYVEARLAALGG
ncbi:MAG: autotransporter outer membrane beta-barrel domain-containing protein, partial [Planctomycetota bacterium]